MSQATNFWDQQFAVEGYKYGTAPNAFLTEQAHRIAPHSKVLVPGDGEGRNGVWLAEQGHQVTALDASAIGLQKAKALAMDRRVSVQLLQADLADWQAETLFDAVVLTYVHLPPGLRPPAHRRLAHARAGARLAQARRPARHRGARQGRARGAGREGAAVCRGCGGAGTLGLRRAACSLGQYEKRSCSRLIKKDFR